MKRIALSQFAKVSGDLFGLSHIAERIGSLCISTKCILEHVRTDTVWIPNGKLIATCIIRHRSDAISLELIRFSHVSSVVGTSNKWSRCDFSKSHRFGNGFQFIKLGGRDVAHHRQVLRTRLQILA